MVTVEMLEAAALLCPGRGEPAVGAVRPAGPSGPGGEPWVVLPGRGPGEDLEAGLRQLAWLRQAGLFRGEAVIWDEALDREGRQLALRLALRWPWVICCPPGELEEWLREAVRQTDGVPQ
ncbi:MAG: hypothetical protein ACLT5P_08420 [Flavonifractor plautii]